MKTAVTLDMQPIVLFSFDGQGQVAIDRETTLVNLRSTIRAALAEVDPAILKGGGEVALRVTEVQFRFVPSTPGATPS